MHMVKCPNCGAPVSTNPDGSTPGCTYCGLGVTKAIDPVALAHTLSRHISDIHKFVESLATMLESGFAHCTEIDRGGVFTKHISEIRVTVGTSVYRLDMSGGHAKAHRSKAVRGVTLKAEELPLHKWLEDLSHGLADMATENEQAQEALQKFVR